MSTEKPFLDHLSCSADLETTYEEIRAGFVALALERNRRATPFVEQARSLKAAASLVSSPAELVNIPAIQLALLTASGVSDKAKMHLQPEDKQEAIQLAYFKLPGTSRGRILGRTSFPFSFNTWRRIRGINAEYRRSFGST